MNQEQIGKLTDLLFFTQSDISEIYLLINKIQNKELKQKFIENLGQVGIGLENFLSLLSREITIQNNIQKEIEELIKVIR